MSVWQIVGPYGRWRPESERAPPPERISRRLRFERVLCGRLAAASLPRAMSPVVKRHSIGVRRFAGRRVERWLNGPWPAWRR